MTMKTGTLTINTPDGKFSAYAAYPDNTPAPAIVVMQEIFGVNKVMRDICDSLARQGFVAVCPDLFWRIQPGIDITDQTEEEWKQAFGYFQAFDVDAGIRDVQATITHVRNMDETTGKVGTVGYCLGGKLAYLSATRTDTDAAVGYYGVGLDALLDEAGNIAVPLMLHIATEDGFVPKDAQKKVHEALDKNTHVTLHDYVGNDHAFARVGGAHYDAEAAKLANGRTATFFNNHLG
ncbi:dienelactone hydrolase family protein [Futiania mangrovi]|uniref:Dienelactone hydrolase family protein n=1 Tax=Futiania mangrovi TaxID=2959716 RepID=A0A9J6PDQ2_9PROT|nr:dienelactone hydrolase family protein [Futiania mangrovii]MCP1336502.1 dienelactone hydrolase family protein [Futiania mangrovii]